MKGCRDEQEKKEKKKLELRMWQEAILLTDLFTPSNCVWIAKAAEARRCD